MLLKNADTHQEPSEPPKDDSPQQQEDRFPADSSEQPDSTSPKESAVSTDTDIPLPIDDVQCGEGNRNVQKPTPPPPGMPATGRKRQLEDKSKPAKKRKTWKELWTSIP